MYIVISGYGKLGIYWLTLSVSFNLFRSINSSIAPAVKGFEADASWNAVSAPTILDPLLAYLVSTYLEFPDLSRYFFKILLFVNVYTAILGVIFGESLLHPVVAGDGITGYKF